ncbi:YbaB/EbfC family nucleoid-associated protein [Micromonospora sp. CPCC 205539]|uniref:YbaB/EbfC family nucleoid-associated protein n=1 Tax=Micromonospora sp. CPCC 205539 TaxID=3122408 RepID=UPI002FF2DAFD
MAADPVSGEFTRMLDATMQALGALSPPAADDDGAPAEPPAGEAADGQVRAEMGTDGRLRSLWVEPRLMRLGSEELTEHITTAVNAAIDAMRGAATPPQVGDLSQLREQLAQVRDTAVPRMGSFLQALTDAQERMAGGDRR